ncbi:MAG: hypothetical protein V7647_1858 [Acidobacteriota bacterium]|jgi:hypothetical protein
MNEDALREMIRQAVARRLEAAPDTDRGGRPVAAAALDMSHARYALEGTDGPCLIEPSVACNHCGYCESHGH